MSRKLYQITLNPWERTAVFTRFDTLERSDQTRAYRLTDASARRLGRYLRATDAHIALTPMGIEYYLTAY